MADSTGRAERAAINLICDVRQSSRPWQLVRLEDLSAEGFRITGLNQPSLNKPLSIRIPGMQLLVAEVRWQEGPTVGCAFRTPLHVAVFEHLVRVAHEDARILGRG
ncbi:MAG: PilZ domain-containing protein [Novosphingobium sp.]|nr:PilZ domain-containing protein [Novosphingobium sp.]MBK9011736.1 PilZ domain-containing protein [Novosphingobium sp.]